MMPTSLNLSPESLNILGHDGRKPLTIVLVGVGGFGATHLRAIRRMEDEGRVRLAGVIDPYPERLPGVFDSLTERGVGWHLCWEDMIAERGAPDCVSLAVPIPLHMEYAVKAYAAGSYVYLEKPPVPLLAQIDQLIGMQGTDHRIQVGFTFPYSEPMLALRKRLLQGDLGEILSYRLTACWPRSDSYYQRASWAGKLWDNGLAVYDGPATNALAHRVHDFLSIESIMGGAPVVQVRCGAEKKRPRQFLSIDVCCARGHFSSGADFAFSLSHATRKQTELALKITGTKGSALLNKQDIRITDARSTELYSESEESIYRAYRDFLETAAIRGRPKVGLLETRSYVAVTNAMFASSRDIHSIPAKYIEKVEGETGGLVYHVSRLNDYSQKAFDTGRNFSEIGVPWAVAAKQVNFDHAAQWPGGFSAKPESSPALV